MTEIPDRETALPLQPDQLPLMEVLRYHRLVCQVPLHPGLVNGGGRTKWVTEGKREQAWFPTVSQVDLEIPNAAFQRL